MLYSSCRKFKIWSYTVSHSSLLLRSIMKFPDEDGFSEDTAYNIDIEFWAVTFISIPTFFANLKIAEITESCVPDNINKELYEYNQKVFELQVADCKYYVIAGGLLIGVNRWENEDRISNYDLNLEYDDVLVKT